VTSTLHLLFPGLEIVGARPFHVARDAEMSIQEIETDDLLSTIEEAVWRRRFRDVVRLPVDTRMPEALLEILTRNLEIEPAASIAFAAR
jgi:polyphosphate kinase